MIIFLLGFTALACKTTLEFTQCKDGSQAALVTPWNCTNTTEYLLENLPCNTTCKAGWFLDLDTENRSLKCSECPAGSYSIGGGNEYLSWSSFKSEFMTYCWSMSDMGWELNTDCTTWHSSSDSLLSSGTSSLNKWYETRLEFFPTLVKRGSLIVSYRKQGTKYQGAQKGEFFIYVDEELYYTDFSFDNFKWMKANITIEPGFHKISIGFNKFTNEQNTGSQIRDIQIRGTQYSSKKCEPCLIGSSGPGADSCNFCERGTFLSSDASSCTACPRGFTSEPGSRNSTDCYEMPKCNTSDYHYYYSACEDGVMKKVYEWNMPVLCKTRGETLPSSEDLDCRPCRTGQYYEGTVCQSCPIGTFIENGLFGNACESCPAGNYAPKVSVYSEWSEIPESFQTHCHSNQDSSCSSSWETRGTYITTSPVYPSNTLIILHTRVEIVEDEGMVEVVFNITGSATIFNIIIDEIVVKSFIGDQSKTQILSLAAGEHSVKWTCNHSLNANEACSIHEIIFHGTKDGGAHTCLSCKPGMISTNNSDSCTACYPGYTSDISHTSCIKCDKNSYSNSDGVCVRCAEGLVASSNQTFCLTPDRLEVGNSSFLVRNLSGTEGVQSEYCNENRLKLSCYETFYGPTEGDNSLFYLSALNPSDLLIATYFQLTEAKAYAFAIMDKKDLNFSAADLSRVEECSASYSKIAVNLGGEVESVKKSPGGFNVTYINGDYCNNDTRFSSKIIFMCDKDEKEGWPLFYKKNGCDYLFYWPTIHACELCDASMMIYHNSTCVKGERIIRAFEGPNCLFDHSKFPEVFRQPCNELRVYKTWPFVISMIITGIMLIVVTGTIICACKTKNRYQRLIQYRADGRNIEMQE